MYGFKDFDIRGTKEEGVDEKLAEKVGIYFPDVNKEKSIIVGHDHRKTSKALLKRLIKGLKYRGLEIYNVGLCTSPAFYYAVRKFNFKSGIMITASHSPKEQNGFKFVKENSQPIYSVNGLDLLEKLVIKSPKRKPKTGGVVRNVSFYNLYHDDLLNDSKVCKKLKIVVDAGNGMGALDIPLLRKLADVRIMNSKLNPDFPGRGPNPILPDVLVKLCEKVKMEKADFGVGYDGDADRSVFVDNLGKVIPADYMMALFADKLAKAKNTLVYDLRLTKAIEDVAKKRKLKIVKSKVGHSRVVDMMIRHDGVVGAEYSCHFYFKDLAYTDSGIYATLKLLEIVSKEKNKLSSLLKKYKKYYLSEEINLKVADKSKIKQFDRDHGKHSHLDGYSVDHGDVWYNVRASHTEDLVRIRVEAKTQKLMKDKINEIKDRLLN
ncbi:hypothetical protein KY321_04070 [Candidatus Woesearchaeota archaeon]|nr:hypothetical protein [Candidatus Woesearchaeota archaeon]